MITNLFFFTAKKKGSGKMHVFIDGDYNQSVCRKYSLISTPRSMHPISSIKYVLEYSNICKACKRVIEKELENGKTEQDQQTATQEE